MKYSVEKSLKQKTINITKRVDNLEENHTLNIFQ